MAFLDKLKAGLAKTKNALFGQIDEVLKAFVKVDEDLLDELEELLIMSDVGVNATEEIIDRLRDEVKSGRLKEKEQVINTLKSILEEMIGEGGELDLTTTPEPPKRRFDIRGAGGQPKKKAKTSKDTSLEHESSVELHTVD